MLISSSFRRHKRLLAFVLALLFTAGAVPTFQADLADSGAYVALGKVELSLNTSSRSAPTTAASGAVNAVADPDDVLSGVAASYWLPSRIGHRGLSLDFGGEHVHTLKISLDQADAAFSLYLDRQQPLLPTPQLRKNDTRGPPFSA